MKKILLMFVLVSSILYAQRDSISTSLKWELKGKEIHAQHYNEEHLFIMYDSLMSICDITDSFDLVELTSFPVEHDIAQIKYENNKLYLFHKTSSASHYTYDVCHGISIFDISDLDSIYEIATYTYLDHFICAMQCCIQRDTMYTFTHDLYEGRYNYFTAFYFGSSSLDTTFLYPVENVADLEIIDTCAYILTKIPSDGGCIRLLNLADPDSISEKIFIDVHSYYVDLQIKDSILFISSILSSSFGSDSSGRASKLEAYNISDRDTVVKMSETIVPFYFDEMQNFQYNDSLFFIMTGSGFSIVDISDPNSLSHIAYDSTYYYCGFVKDNYFANVPVPPLSYRGTNMIKIVDFSNPDSLNISNIIYEDFLSGSIMFHNNNLHMILDDKTYAIATSSDDYDFNIENASLYSLTNRLNNIYVQDTIAVISREFKGELINIADIEHPYIISTFDTSVINAVITDSLLFSLSFQNGLSVFNISEPETPILLSNLSEYNYVLSVIPNGDMLYMFDIYRELNILDISNPSEIEVISNHRQFYVQNACLFEDYLIVDSSTGIVKLYSVATPDEPVLISTFAFTDEINDIKLKNHYLYIATDNYIDIYDIWNPESPIFAHRIYNDINDCIAIGDNCLFSSSSTLKKFSLSFLPNYDFTPGWNLVSYPYIDTLDISSAIPVAEEPAFTYNNESRAYDETTELFSNYGFWVMSSNYGNFEIDGSHIPAASLTLELAPGWNLIGGTFTDVPGSIFDSVPEIISPPFYYNRYDRAYEESDTLINHRGYWILSSDSVEVSIP